LFLFCFYLVFLFIFLLMLPVESVLPPIRIGFQLAAIPPLGLALERIGFARTRTILSRARNGGKAV